MNDEVKDLLKQLKSDDETDRRYALEDLSDLSDPLLMDHFISALSDVSTSVREVAIDALISLEAKDSLPKLIEILRSEDFPLRNASIEILNTIAPVDISVFVATLSDNDEDIVKFVLDILIVNSQKINFSENDISVIKNLLTHNNLNVVGACCELLASVLPKEIINYLEEKEFIQNGWVQYSVLHILKAQDVEAFESALNLITEKYKTQESELIAKKWRMK